MTTQKNLIVCNYKTDLDDSVLGFTHEWINEIATHYNHVFVISSELGTIKPPANVTMYSLGVEKGYSLLRRFIEFYRILFSILKHHRIDGLFAHMTQHFVLMAWPILVFKKIPMVMWYAHKATPLTMKLAHKLSAACVTCTKAAFNIPSKKLVITGHGISERIFARQKKFNPTKTFTIVSVGRITKIKGIKELVESVHQLSLDKPDQKIILKLIGRAHTDEDVAYQKKIHAFITKHKMASLVEWTGSVPHHEVAAHMLKSDVTVNLCPTGSLDKAVLEAMALGVPTMVHNSSFLSLMKAADINPIPFHVRDVSPQKLASQLAVWIKPAAKQQDDCKRLSTQTLQAHGLKSTINKIVALF